MRLSIFLILFAMTALTAQKSSAVGFVEGNEFHARVISGRLYLYCPANGNQPPESRYVSCVAESIDPTNRDYFVGPQVAGNSVIIEATHENGKTRSKTSDYDGVTGKSTKMFNLWISTLTQKPLLDYGKNNITYKIMNGSTTVSEGSFVANVIQLPEAVCAPGSYSTPSAFDCQYPDAICDRYFADRNFCE